MANRRMYLAVAVLIFGAALAAQSTQTLKLPEDPPLVAVGNPGRLMFHVSPLSSRGLLSEQVRNALKAVLKLNGGARIVHIRAFSAGNGDVRRIPQIVSDLLGPKHSLPSISVLQVGALPMQDAQVVLETVSEGKKDVNKNGVTFYAGESAVATEPTMTLKPLLEKAIDQLAAKMTGKTPLAVTCFVSDLDESQNFTQMVAAMFPGAAVDLVQPRRLAWQTEASCEGVASGGGVGPELAFSGTQVGFGTGEKDAAVAVQRLDRALYAADAAITAKAQLLRIYALSPATTEVVRKQAGGSASVASFPVEGVGPATAGFAIDAVSPAQIIFH